MADGKLYIKDTGLPTKNAANKQRNVTTKKLSKTPSNTKAQRLTTLARPSFAPGANANTGGIKLSTKYIISESDTNNAMCTTLLEFFSTIYNLQTFNKAPHAVRYKLFLEILTNFCQTYPTPILNVLSMI